MNKKDRLTSALMAVFPSLMSFNRFSKDMENHKVLESLVAFASCNRLISTNETHALEDFIRDNADLREARIPPGHLTFDDLFENKEILLQPFFQEPIPVHRNRRR